MKTHQASDVVPAKPRAKITTGEVSRMLRELKGWPQKELSSRCGISPSNLSQLEVVAIIKKRRNPRRLALHFVTDPLGPTIRKNTFAAGLSGHRLHFQRRRGPQPVESIRLLT